MSRRLSQRAAGVKKMEEEAKREAARQQDATNDLFRSLIHVCAELNGYRGKNRSALESAYRAGVTEMLRLANEGFVPQVEIDHRPVMRVG